MIALRKLLIVFLICPLAKTAFSQQQYYIYIQSEDHRSFYVRMGNELLPSSGNGYLVVPGLEKSTYELIVGFPETKTAEWRFSCAVGETDLGFILQRRSNGGPQLLNLKRQDGLTGTIVEQLPKVKTDTGALPTGSISNDRFSLMLAEVVNDPSIRLPVIVEQRTAPPVLASREDPAPPSIGNVSLVAGQYDSTAVAAASVTDTKTAPRGIAGNRAEKQESHELKEVEKAIVVQTDKSSKNGAVEKAGGAVAVHTEKKYESFVVKETPLSGNIKAEDSLGSATVPKTTDNPAATRTKEDEEPFVVKETILSTEKAQGSTTPAVENRNDSEEMKYLPFVIKPGAESQRGADNQQSKAGPAVVVGDEKKTTSHSVKKENKQSEESGKDKSAKTGASTKDSAAVPPREGRPVAGAEKKAVLSSVKKTLERRSRDGVDLIYIDENINGARDTIRIFIPGIK